MTETLLATVTVILALATGAFALLRRRTSRRIDEVWSAVEVVSSRTVADDAPRFDPAMVADLPEPARRYLLHSIAPGTPLATSVRLSMPGELRSGPDTPLLPMESEELLVPGRTFVWRADVGRGVRQVVGFDRLLEGRGEMRWWLWGMIPVATATGEDISRSAVGRMLGESVFLPSALLTPAGTSRPADASSVDPPDLHPRWEAVDDATARVTVAAFGEETTLTLDIDPDGRLRRVTFPRWNGDPRNGPVGYLPFGSDRFAEERSVAGYTIPTRVRAGWRLGDEDEYPFFFARITEIEYR